MATSTGAGRFCRNADATIASVDYGGPHSAVVRQANFRGVQFHPERSGAAGARILHNFLRQDPCS